jgi:hypothetical protein
MQVVVTSYEIIIGLNRSKYCMYFNRQNEHFYLDPLCYLDNFVQNRGLKIIYTSLSNHLTLNPEFDPPYVKLKT